MAKCRHPKRYLVDLDECVRCRCGEHLSLGPSNDDIPSGEMIAAVMADSDDYWIGFDDPDGYDWDASRPIAEQWPWGPADPEHMACGDAMLDEVINRFAPSDTASREPWHTTEETQSTGNSETIDALIERSSVGQGLRNIRENGIDAELKQLEEEMKLLPDAHGGADL